MLTHHPVAPRPAGQRIVFNEPLVILSAKGLPMLLRSRVCSCLFSEACVEYLAQGIEAFGSGLSALTSA